MKKLLVAPLGEAARGAVAQAGARAQHHHQQEDAPEDAEGGERVRTRLRSSARPISCQWSRSNRCALRPRYSSRKRLDRADRGGAPGREEAGEGAGDDQQRGRRDGRRRGRPRGCGRSPSRVMRARHHLQQRRRRHQADVAGDRGDQHRLLQDQADDRPRRGAERLAHADLPGALLDRDHHDVGDADDAGEQRADADHPDEGADAAHQVDEALEVARPPLLIEHARARPSGSKSWRSAMRWRRSSAIALLSSTLGVADRDHDHGDAVGAAEGALRGRDREVDLLAARPRRPRR